MTAGGQDLASAFAQTKAEVATWLLDNWDPDLSVREWWARFAASGWAFPHWPEAWGGRELPPWATVAVSEAAHDLHALRPPDSPGQSFGAHALFGFGTEHQRNEYVPALARGEEFWCQLFSEPNAGSDLASLQTRAELHGDRWVVNGQKTWSSAAQYADRGLLLARTDPDAVKQKGISLFIIDLDQPGVIRRPIRQMNDRDEFVEVFLDGAETPADQMIGDPGAGWSIAMMVLAFERQEVGGSGPPPGRLAGLLDARAGDVASGAVTGPTIGLTFGHNLAQLLVDAARSRAIAADAQTRDLIAEVAVLNAALDAVRRRVWATAASGKPPGPGASVGKLAFARLARATRDVAIDLLTTSPHVRVETGGADAALQEAILTIPGLTVGQGTDEIQRNILADRVLGLPREQLVDATDPGRIKVSVR